MAKYEYSDFQIGDEVYHLSNKKLRMVVIDKNEANNLLTCRWLDAKGVKQESDFLPQELGKSKDLGIKIYTSPI